MLIPDIFLWVTLMSKMPLFFVLVVAVIVGAASFRYVQQRREKQANDAAPLLQKAGYRQQ